MLERLRFPHAAVYHTGQMHSHGESGGDGGGAEQVTSHGALQWLRNWRERGARGVWRDDEIWRCAMGEGARVPGLQVFK